MKYPIGFTITEVGFRVTFENGYTISVAFVEGNYCDNYWDESTRFFGGVDHIQAYLKARPEIIPKGGFPDKITCPNAEIAIWAPSGDWITQSVCDECDIECGDDVVGHVTPKNFLKICNYIAKLEE